MLDPISYKKTKDVDEKYAVKTAVIEKELNDFQNTLANVNINQEAKQSVTGYGIVSLPKNCANGQVSAVVRGLTATNLVKNGNFAKDLSWWGTIYASLEWESERAKVIANSTTSTFRLTQNLNLNTINKYYFTLDYQTQYFDKLTSVSVRYGTAFVKPTSVNKTRLSAVTTLTTGGTLQIESSFSSVEQGVTSCYIDNIICIDLTSTFGAGNEPDLATCDKMFATWFDGTKSTVSAVRVKSESADKKQTSMLYLNAGQVLRSLLNGTKDEVSAGKLNKKISSPIIFNGSETWVAEPAQDNDSTKLFYLSNSITNYAQYKNGTDILSDKLKSLDTDYIYLPTTSEEGISKNLSGTIRIRISKSKLLTQDVAGFKAWLQANPVTLIYQLATPEVIPIQSSGSLFGYPSGTVYVEGVLPVAGIYETAGISVTYPDFPIASIEKISKIDPATGVETEVPVTSAVIASDKLSFTHPSLVAGDIIFFTYYHAVEGTVGEATIGYYDSRYTIKDSSNGKYYQWKIVSNNGVPSITLVEV